MNMHQNQMSKMLNNSRFSSEQEKKDLFPAQCESCQQTDQMKDFFFLGGEVGNFIVVQNKVHMHEVQC